MTFTIQEVPEIWDMQDIQLYDSMYDKTLADIIADQENSMNNCLVASQANSINNCLVAEQQNSMKNCSVASQANSISNCLVAEQINSLKNCLVASQANSINNCLVAEQQNSMNNCLIREDEIKLEDPYTYMQYQPTTTTSMLALPSMNMPIFCESSNEYVPSPEGGSSTASPSNTYINSPCNSSTYSASPLPPDDFSQYMAIQQQSYSAQPHVVPQSEYVYYDYAGNNYMGKRRLRDEELSREEYEKRRLRRERNREAAFRCRNRRRERIDVLEQETREIEAQNEEVESDIKQLQNQIKELKAILQGHVCKGKEVSPANTTHTKLDHDKMKPETS